MPERRARHKIGYREADMDWDDVKPKPAKAIVIGEALDTQSVAELEVRLTALAAEVERVGTEIERKRGQNAAADALFKGQ